jgi:hypothetical protein
MSSDKHEMLPEEVGPLSRELALGYLRLLRYYRHTQGLNPDNPEEGYPLIQADLLARDPGDLEGLKQRVIMDPPDQISWWALSRLAEQEPDAVQEGWERLKKEAFDELESGHRASLSVTGLHHSPWDLARHLAIRQGMIDDWQPRQGIEMALVETLATAYSQQLFWTERHVNRAAFDAEYETRDIEYKRKWTPTQISISAAEEQAIAMVDRWNRLFMRTLRALRDLRRYAPMVKIEQAGQVNIGQQQVNVAGDVAREDSKRVPLDVSE